MTARERWCTQCMMGQRLEKLKRFHALDGLGMAVSLQTLL